MSRRAVLALACVALAAPFARADEPPSTEMDASTTDAPTTGPSTAAPSRAGATARPVDARTKLLVLELEGRKIDPEDRAAMTGLVAAGIAKRGDFEVLSGTDVRRLAWPSPATRTSTTSTTRELRSGQPAASSNNRAARWPGS